ncbi:MAG: hypothetical protein MK193_09230 [Lentisphaeria bacterium]|nr:hypothetical protein [Lentisphaeria bacterium]
MTGISKQAEKYACICFIIQLPILIFTWALSGLWAPSALIKISVFPQIIALIFTAVAWWRSILVRKEHEEELEREQIAEKRSGEDLFGDHDESMRIAKQGRKDFDKWALPIVSILVGVIGLVAVYSFASKYSVLSSEDSGSLLAMAFKGRSAVSVIGLSICLLVPQLILAAFLNGLSRSPEHRWMRAPAHWIFVSGFMAGVGAILGVVEVKFLSETFSTEALYVLEIKVTVWCLILLGILFCEILLGQIFEYYRPRYRKTLDRPVYESRILGVIFDPGGIAHNVAHALDYQFGFKISETSFYRFLERGVFPFVLAVIVVLYLLDCVFMVRPGERGLRITMGKAGKTILNPGVKFKLPIPFQSSKIVNTEEIRSFTMGVSSKFAYASETAGPADEYADKNTVDKRVIVWTVKHVENERIYLVATHGTSRGELGDIPEVNMLSLHAEVQYQVDETNIHAFLYNYENPEELLYTIAEQQLVGFLANADLVSILGEKRGATETAIEDAIEEELLRLNSNPETATGLTIVNLSMVGVHPPLSVAESFQSVVSAREEKYTEIEQAKAYKQTIEKDSLAESYNILSAANNYKVQLTLEPESEAAQFRVHMKNYKLAPDLFRLIAYLEVLEKISEDEKIRKFAVAAKSGKRLTNVIYQERKLGYSDLDTEKK